MFICVCEFVYRCKNMRPYLYVYVCKNMSMYVSLSVWIISICVSIYIPATECGKNLSPQILERLGGFPSKSGFLVYVKKSEAKDSVQARSPGWGRVAALPLSLLPSFLRYSLTRTYLGFQPLSSEKTDWVLVPCDSVDSQRL